MLKRDRDPELAAVLDTFARAASADAGSAAVAALRNAIAGVEALLDGKPGPRRRTPARLAAQSLLGKDLADVATMATGFASDEVLTRICRRVAREWSELTARDVDDVQRLFLESWQHRMAAFWTATLFVVDREGTTPSMRMSAAPRTPQPHLPAGAAPETVDRELMQIIDEFARRIAVGDDAYEACRFATYESGALMEPRMADGTLRAETSAWLLFNDTLGDLLEVPDSFLLPEVLARICRRIAREWEQLDYRDAATVQSEFIDSWDHRMDRFWDAMKIAIDSHSWSEFAQTEV